MKRGAPRRGLLLLALLVALGIFWGRMERIADSADPLRADAIKNPPFPSLSYGMQAFLWWDEYTASLSLHMLRRAGFSHVKQVFAWRDMQTAPDEWHFSRADEIVEEAAQKDLQLIVRLGYTPAWAQPPPGANDAGADFVDAPPAPEHLPAWGEYCGAIAGRYAGRIAGYQIWNEPNLAREWGGRPVAADEYIALLRICSEAIRAQDDTAIIISAGLAPTGTNDPAQAIADDGYLRQLYEGNFQQYVDVVGAHAVGFTAPEIAPADAHLVHRAGRWASFRRIEDLRRIMVEAGDAARQMAILEMGWTIDPRPESEMAWFAVDPETQAEYFARGFAFAAEHWRPWVGLISGIYIAQPGWTKEDEQYWWSLVHFKGDAKDAHLTPAFRELIAMPKVCDDAACPQR